MIQNKLTRANPMISNSPGSSKNLIVAWNLWNVTGGDLIISNFDAGESLNQPGHEIIWIYMLEKYIFEKIYFCPVKV